MSQILHVFCETHHHNIEIIKYFNSSQLLNTQHSYVIFDPKSNIDIYSNEMINAYFFDKNSLFLPWLKKNHTSFSQIIVHGFFNHTLWEVLEEKEDICNKTSWVIFGADLFIEQYLSSNIGLCNHLTSLRKKCVPKLKSILCNICSEVELEYCKTHYGLPKLTLKYAYYNDYSCGQVSLPVSLEKFLSQENIVILGNSADSSNNHIDLLNKLYDGRSKINLSVRILCPLNYAGNHEYISKVISYGKQLYGNDFFAITDMLTTKQYYYAMSLCHYFIMGQKRQQGGHNWIFWMKQGRPAWGDKNAPIPKYLIQKGAKINPIEQQITLDMTSVQKHTFKSNMNIYQNYFTRKKVSQLWCRNFLKMNE